MLQVNYSRWIFPTNIPKRRHAQEEVSGIRATPTYHLSSLKIVLVMTREKRCCKWARWRGHAFLISRKRLSGEQEALSVLNVVEVLVMAVWATHCDRAALKLDCEWAPFAVYRHVQGDTRQAPSSDTRRTIPSKVRGMFSLRRFTKPDPEISPSMQTSSVSSVVSAYPTADKVQSAGVLYIVCPLSQRNPPDGQICDRRLANAVANRKTSI